MVAFDLRSDDEWTSVLGMFNDGELVLTLYCLENGEEAYALEKVSLNVGGTPVDESASSDRYGYQTSRSHSFFSTRPVKADRK